MSLTEQLQKGVEAMRAGRWQEAADAMAPTTADVRLVGVSVDPESEPVQGSADNNLRGRFLSLADEVVLSASAASALSVGPGDRVQVLVPVNCDEDIPAAECPPSVETFSVVGVLSNESVVPGPYALLAENVVSSNIVAMAPEVASNLEGEAARRTAAARRSRTAGHRGPHPEVAGIPVAAPSPAVGSLAAAG